MAPFSLTTDLWEVLQRFVVGMVGLKESDAKRTRRSKARRVTRSLRAAVYGLMGRSDGEWWLRKYAGFSEESREEARRRLDGDVVEVSWDAVWHIYDESRRV